MNRQEGKIIKEQQPKESSPLTGKSTWLPLCLHHLLPVGLIKEMKLLTVLAGPVFLSEFFIYIVDVVSSIFAGHLGKIELDSVSLAVSIINVTGTSVGLGLSSGCSTLMSQTYGGKNMKRVGTILQRGILILLLFCFPCWAIFINTENILLLLRQDPSVARLAGTYMMIFIPALPAVFMFQLQIQYLQNQSIIWPPVITGVVVNIINVLLNATFLYGVNLGIVGSAWANTISQILMCFMLFVYIRVKKLHVDTWEGWSSDCFQEWGTFIRLAFPSMLWMCAELWTFETGGFLAGKVSVVTRNSQGQVIRISAACILFLQLPLGFSAAASVRVGNALGAGDINQAKLASRASLLCTGGFAVLMCTLLAGLNKQLPYIFTSDKLVKAQVLAGFKSNEIGHHSRADAGFGLVENGHLPYSASRQFVEDHNIPGGIIVPDIAPRGKYTEQLVQQEDSAIESTNIVGEILSVKQLILWRGLAVVLAVTTLIIGVTMRYL
ncbi:multidrug and toxin extrusion protein 2-like [Pelodytes ibericus]